MIQLDNFHNWPVDFLPFSTRVLNAFRAAGIKLVSQLCAISFPDLMQLNNLGRTSCNDIARVLQRFGCNLADESQMVPLPPAFPSVPSQAWVNLPLVALSLPPSIIKELRRVSVCVVGDV